MSWNKKILFILISLMTASTFANEHGEEKPAAAAGGEHGGAPAAAEVNYSGRQTDEWLKVQAELTTLKGKVETQKGLVEGLVMAKAHSGGHSTPEESETLKKEHEALIKMIEDYNNLTTTFQNRFPEKGAAVGRVYKRINPDSIETIETNLTAEGRMRRLDNKIKKQYEKTPVKEHKEVVTEVSHEGHQESHKESKKEKKKLATPPSVTDQIILQK